MFNIFRTGEATSPLKHAWEQGGEKTRRAILKATQAIDRLLSSAPHEQGESREAGRRVIFADPVGVEFEIDDANRRVNVVRAWAYGKAALFD
jgi:hypothetical protein